MAEILRFVIEWFVGAVIILTLLLATTLLSPNLVREYWRKMRNRG